MGTLWLQQAEEVAPICALFHIVLFSHNFGIESAITILVCEPFEIQLIDLQVDE